MLCVGVSLSITNALTWLALVGLTMIAKCLSVPSGNLRKNKGLLLTGPVNYIAHLVPHSKVIGGERVSGPRVLLLFYSGVGGLGF